MRGNREEQTLKLGHAVTLTAIKPQSHLDAQTCPQFERTVEYQNNSASDGSIVLTSAIETRSDGVQKGVLWGQEALHHWHLDPDVGRPTAGWRSHHPRGTPGGFQGLSAGAGDFGGGAVQCRQGHTFTVTAATLLRAMPLSKTIVQSGKTKLAHSNNAEVQDLGCLDKYT